MIIAHVDHGKTTLVDCLLRQCGQFRDAQLRGERILDTNDLERERGITIVSKNIAIPHKGVKINIIDTPGHADFGGEVERVLSMADGALLLVDAAEGPMPQTRFVLSKALACGLQPIIVVNKIDRPDARSHQVLDETFELVMELGGDERLTDVPFVFTTAKEGYATDDPDRRGASMECLLDLVLEKIPGPASRRTIRCRCSSPRSTGRSTWDGSPSGGSRPERCIMASGLGCPERTARSFRLRSPR